MVCVLSSCLSAYSVQKSDAPGTTGGRVSSMDRSGTETPGRVPTPPFGDWKLHLPFVEPEMFRSTLVGGRVVLVADPYFYTGRQEDLGTGVSPRGPRHEGTVVPPRPSSSYI